MTEAGLPAEVTAGLHEGLVVPSAEIAVRATSQVPPGVAWQDPVRLARPSRRAETRRGRNHVGGPYAKRAAPRLKKGLKGLSGGIKDAGFSNEMRERRRAEAEGYLIPQSRKD